MPKSFKNQKDRNRHNEGELRYIAEYLLERLKSPKSKESVPGVIEVVTQYLQAHKIALDVDDHTLSLKAQLFELIRKKQTDQLDKVLKQWAAGYEAAVELAEKQSKENQKIHASQPHGIYRGLTEKQKIGYTVWGEDLDILVALKGIITIGPKDILANGTYILPPVSIEGLQEKLIEVRDEHLDKTLTLLVPVNCGQNHWQLQIAKLVNGTVTHFSNWDSIQQGVQKNGYSCMDYSVRQALHIKFGDKAPTQDLQAIMDANNAQSLREAIVNRILNVHTKMKSNTDLQQSVREQVAQRPQVEKLHAIDVNNENQLHAELIKNKNMQVEFDGLMAAELEKLYKDNPEENEKKLLKTARQLAYQYFLTKYGVFAQTSKPSADPVVQPAPVL